MIRKCYLAPCLLGTGHRTLFYAIMSESRRDWPDTVPRCHLWPWGRVSSVKLKCGFRGRETHPEYFNKSGVWNLKTAQVGLQQSLACSGLTWWLSSCQNLSGASGVPWGPTALRSWVSTLPPHTHLSAGSKILSLFSLSPPFTCSDWRKHVLGSFPWQPSQTLKGGDGAGSIFEKKAVNVKPVLIYSGEL